MTILKDGESVRFTGDDLSPLQRAIAGNTNAPAPAPTKPPDAFECLAGTPAVKAYEARIRDAWKEPK